MQGDDEGVLIDRARRGDAASFEALVRRHDRSVLGLALRLTGSREEARDIYQETFLRAFQSLPKFRRDCAFRTWVLRISTNVVLDFRRRTGPAPPGAGTRAAEAEGACDRPDGHPAGNPERALLGEEIRRRLAAALQTLTPRERLVFELRHFEGERLTDVARVLETTEETVRNCLYRAHLRLRERLGDLAPAGSGTPGRRADGEPGGGRSRT